MATLDYAKKLLEEKQEVAPAPEDRMGRLEAFGRGFTGGLASGTHGIAQPLLESGFVGDSVADWSRDVGAARQARMAEAQSDRPLAATLGAGVGGAIPAAGAAIGAMAALPASATAGAAALGARVLPGLAGRIGAGMGAGAAGGASQYVNPGESRLQHGLMGAAFGGAFPVAGAVAGKGLKSIREAAEPYAQAAKISELGQWMGNLPKNVFDKVKANETVLKSAERQAWEKTDDIAKAINTPFDKAPYISDINRQINKLEGQAKANPNLASERRESIELLNSFKESKLDNWDDVINAKKALNEAYRIEKTPGKSPPFETIKKSIGFLDEAIDKNFAKTPMPLFKNQWSEAKELTRDINQTFYERIAPRTGTAGRSGYATMGATQSPYAPRDSFIEQYIPKTAKDGVTRMEQFGAMVGNKQEAADMMRPYVFSNAMRDGEVDLKKMYTQYNKLSDDQRNLLFTPAQNKIIKDARSSFEKNPAAFGVESGDKENFIKQIFSKQKGAIGGGALGAMTGGLPGAALGYGAGYAMPRIFERQGANIVRGLESPAARELADTILGGAPYVAGATAANQ